MATSLTEVGTLEVHCIELDDPTQRWLLEFQLRREHAQVNLADDAAQARHPALDQAIDHIDRCFGSRAQKVDPKEVKRLRSQLEQLLGPRESWNSALLRELFGALWERARRRRRSADHERLWLNLAGYCVRPGFGYPLDEWRVEQLWSLFDDGIQYVNESQVWSEWWTLWRRAAGGLDERAAARARRDGLSARRGACASQAAVRRGEDRLHRHGSLERIARTDSRGAQDRARRVGADAP
ncbi:hypothetical protein ACFQI9_00790 [Paraburkholderia dipogonis]|uniref:hypothetical protein n=1 Tax=Paraburkholderia dipogonis TaxID=1211383 RepID=UPI0036130104